ncbi:MAG: amino acid ABC transporter permease [Eubacterium sp.]|nr:amino acid ABC transporter permease [Eubacterium sp.]
MMDTFFKDLFSLLYVTFIYEDRWKFFLEGFGMTLLLTLSAFILGSLFGALLCALKLSRRRWIRKISSVFVSLLVQLPTLVLLMIFVYIIFGSVPLSVVVIVIMGLTLKAGSYLADIFYSAVTSVEKGEIEAAHTLGMSKFQTFRYITLPQAVSSALPIYKNQFIITLQETAIVGYLAIVDLTRASDIVSARTLNAMFGLLVISVLYLLIGWAGNSLLSLLGHQKHLGGEVQ